MSVFNTYFNPISKVPMTNADTIFVCTIVGIGNNSNPGTRELPVATLSKGLTLGMKSILFKGISQENCVANIGPGYVIFEGGSYINGSLSLGYTVDCYNVQCDILSSSTSNIYNSIIYNSLTNYGSDSPNPINSFINTCKSRVAASNNTILIFQNYIQVTGILSSGIIVNVVDLYRFSGQTTTYPIFKCWLFRKATLWEWNGSIITINWITNPNTSAVYITETLLERVWNSLYYYANNTVSAGVDRTYFNLMLGSAFASCPIFSPDGTLIQGQTNRVIDDSPISGIPIFNKYDSSGTTILDYTLSINPANIALYMGDPYSGNRFVGCYYPNVGNMIFDNVINVNSDGSDDLITQPDMLITSTDGSYSVNNASTQLRNRTRTNVLFFNAGYTPLNAQSSLISGMNAGFTFGKKRPWSTAQIACESIEVLPYDNLTNPSIFPKFSIPFNGDAKIFYKISNNTPVLFNDLAGLGVSTDINLTEYGNWAVTTADIENLILVTMTSTIVLKALSLSYMKLELNLNFNL